MWRHAISYLIGDGVMKLKRGKHVHQKARKAGLIYEKKHLPEMNKKLISVKSIHLFNLGADLFSLYYFCGLMHSCFLKHSFHIVSLFLSLPISLCSFFKCIAVYFKSFTLSVCLPAFPSGAESVVMY